MSKSDHVARISALEKQVQLLQTEVLELRGQLKELRISEKAVLPGNVVIARCGL